MTQNRVPAAILAELDAEFAALRRDLATLAGAPPTWALLVRSERAPAVEPAPEVRERKPPRPPRLYAGPAGPRRARSGRWALLVL